MQTLNDKAVLTRLIRQVKNLVRLGKVPAANSVGETIRLAMAIKVYHIPLADEVEIDIMRPNGIRILLAGKTGVTAGLDFHYKGKRLFFTHLIKGRHLEIFVNGINKMEEQYRTEKTIFELGYIELLYTHRLFLTVFNLKKTCFYRYHENKVQKISIEVIRNESIRINKNKQQLSNF